MAASLFWVAVVAAGPRRRRAGQRFRPL